MIGPGAAEIRRVLRDEPIVVVSPHMDDGVFACGEALGASPGSVVITVFAGGPDGGTASLTEWDAAAGFREGDDVIAARRAEDALALQFLRARPVWLEFRDAQYGPSPSVDEVAQALAGVLEDVGELPVLFPLGLFHSDHVLTHEACLRAREHTDHAGLWLLYADINYRTIPGLVDERLAALIRRGLRFRRLAPDPRPASERKRWAVASYGSQLRALATEGRPGSDDAFAPECYWLIEATAERK
ncbi:MAG TPA: PIG-L family deacetylase [Chloroflexota bacterium]|nr:PIG-L family deacetylase [Chloroflexota bacterium]